MKYIPVHSHRTTRQRGFTLLEQALALLVAATVIGGIWSVAEMVWDNYRIGRLNQQIISTVQNVRDYYSAINQLPTGAANDITTILDGLQLIPVEMRRNSAACAGCIDHALNNSLAGGSFHVLSVVNANTGKLDVFRIQALGLSQVLCQQALMREPVLMTELAVVQLGTALASTTIDSLGKGSVSLPLSAKTAASWCATGNTNAVYWDFNLRN